jgi:hypothetical protein
MRPHKKFLKIIDEMIKNDCEFSDELLLCHECSIHKDKYREVVTVKPYLNEKILQPDEWMANMVNINMIIL